MPIYLRAVEPSDVDMLYRWENDESLWRVSLTSAPMSRFQLDEYARNYVADIYSERQLRLMMVEAETDEVVGTVDITDFDPHNRRAGIGLFVASPYRRRGYARQALALIDEYVRSTLSIHQLWALVAVDNTASMEMLCRCGFKTSGRLRSWLLREGRYVDVIVLQRLYNN